MVEAAANSELHVLDYARLYQVIISSEPHGGDGRFQRGITGNDNGDCHWGSTLDLLKDPHAVHTLHMEISEDKVVFTMGELLESVHSAQHGVDDVSISAKHFAYGNGHVFIVIHDEQSRSGSTGLGKGVVRESIDCATHMIHTNSKRYLT